MPDTCGGRSAGPRTLTSVRPSDRIVASRAYQDSHGEALTLEILEPQLLDSGLGHSCSFRLLTSRGEEVLGSTVVGIDGVQALVLALTIAGDMLEGQMEGLTFLEQDNLGLLRTMPRADGLWRAQTSFPATA